MSEFKMPSLGADMESAVLMQWLVKEGDPVTKGQVIAEVETSKGVIEIEIFEDGIVDKLLIQTETECSVGTPLALIRHDDEVKEEVPQKEAKTEKLSEVKEEPLAPLPSIQSDKIEPKVKMSEERIKISPAARKKAHELNLDLNSLEPKEGEVIQLKDLGKEVKRDTKTLTPDDGMRQAIAKAMSRSNAEIPHYYLSLSINMTPALTWLTQLNATRSIKERILPAALLIRAVVLTLKEVPELNGFWQKNAHQISKSINPGIAIALRKGGLVTPAILDAQEMNLDTTMQSLDDLITRTRANKLRGSEITQQSITITNLGDLGVQSVYGVIYPPQIAIVGLGRIIDSPWAEGDTLSVRKVMQATLAGDHRATDGRTGALFLDKLNQLLQNPEALL